MTQHKKMRAIIAGALSVLGITDSRADMTAIEGWPEAFDGLNRIDLQPLNTQMPLYLAGHRSHQSHRSHSSHRSHRSSAGSGTRYYTPETAQPVPQPSYRPDPITQTYTPTTIKPPVNDSSVQRLQSAMTNKEKLKNLVMRIQLSLQALGFYSGTYDGVMGPQTRQALNEFRETQGIKPRETLDVETLNALSITAY